MPRIEPLEARQLLSVTVDTLVDVTDPNDNRTSFREAIAAAPANGNTVNFHPSLDGGTIRLGSELAINQPITITGPGAEKLTIDAAGIGRVFHVSSSVSMATISGLKITGGAGVTTGGGILNQGGLLLDSVDVIGNQSTIFGGGVYSDGFSLEVVNSTIADNRSSWGGGVFGSFTGTEWMKIRQSTISGNVADDPNSSNGQGGGIRTSTSSPAGTANVVIENTTISNNRAESQGGGVHFAAGTKANIRSTTITENRADAYAGGIFNESDPILMRNTILAGNTAADAARADGSGSFSGQFGITSRYNFVGIAHSSFQLSTASGDSNLVGTVAVPRNPKLSSLTNAGGRTKVHVPLPLSPVIDFGADGDTGGLAGDQRGSGRQIEDGTTPNAPGNIADIGAVEIGARIAVGDFNGDGREDELRYSPVLKSLLVAEKAATGAGWEVADWGSTALATQLSPTGYNGTIIGDFNGDGRDDVMILDADYSWLLGLSDGTLFHVTELKNNGTPLTAGWEYAYIGDFDDDGDEELIGKAGGATNWTLVDYNGVTGVSKATTVNLPGFTPGTQVFVQDANRDGRDDFITRANASSPWMVTLSNGASSGSLQFGAAADWDAWIDYGYDVATSKLNADKAMAKVIEEFAWVYNNVELELYPGLMKGPEATRQTKAGNNWDQAALLEEKLQALGVGDVKIASGKVRVTVEQFDSLADWLGISTTTTPLVQVNAIFKVLQGSIDAYTVARDANGGDASTTELPVVAIEFTHAWVQAYLPTAAGLAWVNLDPSWKFKDRQAGIPLPSELDSVHTNLSTGVFDEFSYLAFNPTTDRSLPIEFFEDQVMA